jgi:serine/threonine protein kinase
MQHRVLATEFDARASGIVVEWPNGATLGRWRIGALLGSGGSAEVWHAVATDGREAALKLPKREWRQKAAAHALLRREHELLLQLASPHLVEQYELIEHDGGVALALEYLPYGDLVPLLGAPVPAWLPAFRAVVGALGELERHGLAHGDVKARNVLFAADGTARLADLTSARPLDAPAVATTAAYGLPEGERASARQADCFALATLLYELITARLPYGPDGGFGRAPLPLPAQPDAAAAPLLAAAVAALQSRGRVAGLSHFVDVIESVHSVDG